MVVFVLGAGASKPYGYPTGSELKTKILNFNVSLYTSNPNILEPLSEYLGINHNHLTEYINMFKKIFNESNLNSIDQFLSNNPNYDKIGRILISSVLIECEKRSIVRNLGNNEHQHWMSYFFNTFFSNTINNEGFQLLVDNPFNVSFITFNYDRSLEYYLYSGIYNLYFEKFKNTQRSIYKSTIDKFKIYHMYGSIGSIDYNPYTTHNSGDYSKASLDDIIKISQNIHIIHDKERKTNSTESEELLKNAETIIFLGFGYDEYNIKNLLNKQTPAKRTAKTSPYIFGTVYDMQYQEVIEKKIMLQHYFGNNIHIDEKQTEMDCRMYIRNIVDQIPILGNNPKRNRERTRIL